MFEGKDKMNKIKEKFYKIFSEITNLNLLEQLVEWDRQVMMPKGASEQRAQMASTLSRIAHEKLTSPETRDVIYEFENFVEDDWDKAHLREAKRLYERKVNIPKELIEEKTRLSSISFIVWEKAKKESNFNEFEPYIEKLLKVVKEIAKIGNSENPYDYLIDEFEPYMSSKEIEPIFEKLKEGLIIYLKKYFRNDCDERLKPIIRKVEIEKQEKVCRFVLDEIGFDFYKGRLDVSTHPFTTGMKNDVRITTRYREDFIPVALFGALHEGGHALYEQGLPERHYMYPAGQFCSLGIHESQSRFYENIVGRSRSFWKKYFKDINEICSGIYSDLDFETFYKAVNVVKPSYIRVEADEVSYNLHIILRYEIEKEIFMDKIFVKDLPEIWNEKFYKYFGISPKNHSEGLLQDVHWATGIFGYFPTYTLGNLLAAQIRETINKKLGNLNDIIEKGQLHEVKKFMKEKIYDLGRFYKPLELIVNFSGMPLSYEPFLNYIREKYDSLY